MEESFGNKFLGRAHVRYIREPFQNYFRSYFRLESIFFSFRQGKKSTNPNFWVLISSGGVVSLCEGVGAKKFGISLETRETKHFWRDIPGFCWNILGEPEKFEQKIKVQFLAPISEVTPAQKILLTVSLVLRVNFSVFTGKSRKALQETFHGEQGNRALVIVP